MLCKSFFAEICFSQIIRQRIPQRRARYRKKPTRRANELSR